MLSGMTITFPTVGGCPLGVNHSLFFSLKNLCPYSVYSKANSDWILSEEFVIEKLRKLNTHWWVLDFLGI